MKIAITLLAVAALWGCAIQLTEEEAAKCEGDEQCLAKTLENKREDTRYQREDRDIKSYEKYIEFEARCKASGRNVWITRRVSDTCRGNNRDCPPRLGDSYSCGVPLIVQ